MGLNTFKLLWQEIRRRSREPLKDVSYWSYIFVAVIFMGALGVWVQIIKIAILSANVDKLTGCFFWAHMQDLAEALLVYFPAIAGVACAQIVLGEDDEKEYMRSAAFSVLMFVFIIVAVDAVLLYAHAQVFWAIVIGTAMTLFSIFVYWIAHADSSVRGTPTTAPMGGSEDTDMPGDDSEYQT